MSPKKKPKQEQQVLKNPAPSQQKCSLQESIAKIESIIAYELSKGTEEGNQAAARARLVKKAFEKMLEKKP